MEYKRIKQGRFLSRPNRFIANVELEGKEEICHVKNTGRCKELLLDGAEVLLEESSNPSRKTKYDLVMVKKQGRWVNLDSQMPNHLVAEWLKKGKLFSKEAVIKPEKVYENSRFDFYVEDGKRKAFIEVKGVTLEENGRALFPDAPTQRGVKHIKELIACKKEGYEAYLIFVIQMKGVKEFSPNWETHPDFGEALRQAQKEKVEILAYDCMVEKGKIWMDLPVCIVIEKRKTGDTYVTGNQ